MGADGCRAGVSEASARAFAAGGPGRGRHRAAVRRGSLRRHGAESRGGGPLVRRGPERSRPVSTCRAGDAGRAGASDGDARRGRPRRGGRGGAVAGGALGRLPGPRRRRRLLRRERRHRRRPLACPGNIANCPSGLRPDAREPRLHGLSMYRIQDGRIAEIWETRNTLAILRQLDPRIGGGHRH
jgi:hypothetical protein